MSQPVPPLRIKYKANCFYPTVGGPMHLGHLWPALLTSAFTCAGSPTYLRLEDLTAEAICSTSKEMQLEYGLDFIVQTARFGLGFVPIWQSERIEAYEAVRAKLPLADWVRRDNSHHYWWLAKDEPENYRGDTHYYDTFSRVVDDHDLDIGLIIHGMELAPDREPYFYMWDILYPDTPPQDKPNYCFVPLVVDELGFKVSKSTGNKWVLRDNPDLDVPRTLIGLARHYLTPTPAWGYVVNQNQRFGDCAGFPLGALWLLIRTHPIRPDPPPLTEAEVDSWRMTDQERELFYTCQMCGDTRYGRTVQCPICRLWVCPKCELNKVHKH